MATICFTKTFSLLTDTKKKKIEIRNSVMEVKFATNTCCIPAKATRRSACVGAQRQANATPHALVLYLPLLSALYSLPTFPLYFSALQT